MSATKSDYVAKRGENDTGMSDADYYGRGVALGVDIEAAKRAAVREVWGGIRIVMHGNPLTGQLVMRRAVLRLSVTLGNQSRAEDYLGGATYRPEPQTREDEARYAADRAELDKGAGREYAHPGLALQLASIEGQLAEARRQS